MSKNKKKKYQSCAFTRWRIDKKHLDEITPLLFTESEQAGTIMFDDVQPVSSRVIVNSHGKKTEVSIKIDRTHMISFHTHPCEAYKNSYCIYGHPSGDDLREFVRLSTKGIMNHAVFTLEGIYIVQVHPKFTRFYKSLSPYFKKDINNVIYDYFRNFHHKRTINNVIKTKYTPREFVQACNTFHINNTLSKTQYTHDKIFSCVWFYTNNFLDFEHRPHDRWKFIEEKTLPVHYNDNINVEFQFLYLDPEERTLSNVLDTLTDCCGLNP